VHIPILFSNDGGLLTHSWFLRNFLKQYSLHFSILYYFDEGGFLLFYL